MTSELQVDMDAALDALQQLSRTAAQKGLVVEAQFTPVLDAGGVTVARQVTAFRLVANPNQMPS